MHIHIYTLICTHIVSFFMWEEPKVCKGHLEVLCDGIFSMHFTDDMGLVRFSAFFHFADDMGVCVFWVCPTTPMSSAGTINVMQMQM